MGISLKLFGSWQSNAPTPGDPKRSSDRPLSDLRHVFFFPDGDAAAMIDSPEAVATLQCTAGAPRDAIQEKARIVVFSDSGVARQISRTMAIPESAVELMDFWVSAVSQGTSTSDYAPIVRVSTDPFTGKQFAYILLYRK